MNLGLESIVQVLLQTVLLLVASTSTPTTGGLETMFESEHFFGIRMSPSIALGLSVAWSIKTNVMLHVNYIGKDKGHFPFKGYFTTLCWGLFAILRRTLSSVAFFIPSLGLFNILHHWQAEQIPYSIRIDYASKINYDDRITAYNMSETVFWRDLDRWDYTDPNDPKPPPYSDYSGLSLQDSSKAFLYLMVYQYAAIILVKIFTSEEFMKKERIFEKFIHIILNMNLAFPYIDWDVGDYSRDQFKQRYRKVTTEMIWCLIVNIGVSLMMTAPLIFTFFKIRMRHSYLSDLIGTKIEEDKSMHNVEILFYSVIISLIIFSLLEIFFYFLYHTTVKNTIETFPFT